MHLKYEPNKYTYDFQQFEMIRFFSDKIYTGKISIDEANKTRPKGLR